MKLYTSEVEFLRDEVDKCHTSMHSQAESLKLLMKAHLDLKKKVERQWVGLTPEEILDLFDVNNVYGSKWVEFARAVENKLKEKNT